MDEKKNSPSRQHPYTPEMNRRYSFSRDALEAIGKGRQQSSGNASPDKSPRKAHSTPAMIGVNDPPSYWGELLAEHQEKRQQQAAPAPEVEVISLAEVSQGDDVSLMLDIKGQSGHFSDDDSDGSSYSSVCSNEDEYSPTPSSAESSSVTSSSPLLRCEPAGFEALHSEASELSSLDSIPRQDDVLEGAASVKTESISTFSLDMASESHLSPKTSHNKPWAGEENAGNHEDDLPDWLRERVVLSPPLSITKAPARSPQQIEEEIRFAVDSAAARVQQELGRREQFQSELQSAAAFSPVRSIGDTQSVTPKLFSNSGNDLEIPMHDPDDLVGVQNIESQPIVDHDVATNNREQDDLLLLMEVVIGNGRTETIEIHDGDDPDALALAFAQKHALQPDAVPKLRGLIQEQLKALTETEMEEVMQPDQTVPDEWAHDPAFDEFMNTSSYPTTSTLEAKDPGFPVDPVDAQFTGQSDLECLPQMHERDSSREFNYNNLMARYGHYSQHSGKVDPDGSGARRPISTDTPVAHSTQPMEYTRTGERVSATSTAPPRFTTTAHSTRNSNAKKKTNRADAPAYERLYALAESKDKWIKRAQKAKELEQARDQEKMHHVELMAAKSRELVANRTNGGYAHIGERLHGEALTDIAKKVQRHERRVEEREHQQDWMCPKCAYVNQYTDSRCQNVVALAGQKPRVLRGKSPTSSNTARRETASSSNSSFGYLEPQTDVLCGQPKPDRLFQPTLLTTSAGAMKGVSGSKAKASHVTNTRRQRHQSAMEEEFKRKCPFKPKINNVSEEIVREKLESAAAAAFVHGESRQPRDPHLELYENAFQARAMREEREEEYFKQFPFKPDIGVNALWVVPDKSQSDFVERLAVDKYHELERKRVALHDKYAPDRDPHTGKELFKPEIGRAPAFSRNKQGLPIGDFLHAAHREQQEYHRQLREKDQREIKKKSQQTFVSEASRQALERRKAETCSHIFNELVALSRQPPSSGAATNEEFNDTQGEDNSETAIPAQVDLSALPAEISRVVAIVFEYANHAPISRDAFSAYMDRLVREVPGVTYSQIIFLAEHLQSDRGGRHRQEDLEREAALAAAEQKELTFHPVIDKKSREIATKHGRVSSSKVFHALNQYYDHYLERKEKLRQQQQREFKKAHPFQPTLVTKTHQREPAAAAFYDKVRMGNSDDSGSSMPWGATASLSPTSAVQRNTGVSIPPPAPLQTVLSNARPSVRPIESERSRFYTAATTDEAHLEDIAGNISRSSSGSQLLEDAELTSRVLAALDEKPSMGSPSSTSSSYHLTKALSLTDDLSLAGSKVCSVRSPEDSTLSVENYAFADME